MKKFIKFSFLALILMVGFLLMNSSFIQALTIASQNGIDSACPAKDDHYLTCVDYINPITVNGYSDSDTNISNRYTPLPYGYIIPGQTIPISWGISVNSSLYSNYIPDYFVIKYGCDNDTGFEEDNYTIGTVNAGQSQVISWSVPQSVSSYKYCKVWVYAKSNTPEGTHPNPTLGVSNTGPFKMAPDAPQVITKGAVLTY
jgi:hypothetical protein